MADLKITEQIEIEEDVKKVKAEIKEQEIKEKKEDKAFEDKIRKKYKHDII